MVPTTDGVIQGGRFAIEQPGRWLLPPGRIHGTIVIDAQGVVVEGSETVLVSSASAYPAIRLYEGANATIASLVIESGLWGAVSCEHANLALSGIDVAPSSAAQAHAISATQCPNVSMTGIRIHGAKQLAGSLVHIESSDAVSIERIEFTNCAVEAEGEAVLRLSRSGTVRLAEVTVADSFLRKNGRALHLDHSNFMIEGLVLRGIAARNAPLIDVSNATVDIDGADIAGNILVADDVSSVGFIQVDPHSLVDLSSISAKHQHLLDTPLSPTLIDENAHGGLIRNEGYCTIRDGALTAPSPWDPRSAAIYLPLVEDVYPVIRPTDCNAELCVPN